MKTIVAIVALMLSPAAHAVFKCVDEQGRTRIGETPPAECDKVPMLEVSKTGHVLRHIDPTPTPEQVKVREEEARRKREAEKAAAEQARQDKALVNTFASEKEFDVARDRNIAPLNGRIAAAQDRIKEIDKRFGELDNEIETYKAGRSHKNAAKEADVPPVIVAEQERLTREKHSLVSSIAANEKEVRVQRERFERDKKRWVELRSGLVSMPVADRK